MLPVSLKGLLCRKTVENAEDMYLCSRFSNVWIIPMSYNKRARMIDHVRDLTIESRTSKRALSPTYLSPAQQHSKGQ